MSTDRLPIGEACSPVLPPEIIAEIVDHLDAVDDLESLRALSQTAQHLLLHCRKHLFSSVTLNDSCVKRFSRVVKNYPNILSNIKRLDLFLTFDCHIAPCRPLVRYLPRLVGGFCRVSSLSLVFNPALPPDWETIPQSLKSASFILIQAPMLTRLTLGCISGFPITAFLPCVNLVGLKINRASIQNDLPLSDQLKTLSGPPVRLSSFSFRGTGRGTDVTSMEALIYSRRNNKDSIFDFLRLSSLTICLTMEEDIEVAAMLLMSVEQLEIMTGIQSPALPNHAAFTDNFIAVSLVNQDLTGLDQMCRVRSLQSLRCLNIENYYFVASSTNPVKGLCRLLNGLESDAPSQLEEININGSAGRCFSKDSVVGALHKVLQRAHFSALKKVVITIRVEASKFQGKGRGSSKLEIDVLGRSVETLSNVVFILNVRA